MVRIETWKINQTIVHDRGTSTFFSYDTPICTKEADGSITLHTDWNYSVTTGKYRNRFLGEGLPATREKLIKGIYTLRSAYAKD